MLSFTQAKHGQKNEESLIRDEVTDAIFERHSYSWYQDSLLRCQSMELPWALPDLDRDLLGAPAKEVQPTLDLAGKCILSSPVPSSTWSDLLWPLPVQQYERSHASVLNSKPAMKSGKFVYHTFAIRFEMVELGKDPTQRLASEFALITPGRLTPEVAHMSVNLYLPWGAIVKPHISECGSVALSADQVDLATRFNTWLFDAVLGKPPVPPGAKPTFADSPKGYFVLPLQPDSNGGELVEFDWSAMASSLTSGLIYRKKINFSGGFAKLEASDLAFDVEALSSDEIIMRNGRFSEQDLDDAMVTCAHNGMPCYITSISKHIDGSSCFPSEENPECQSYADYFAMKCGYQLKYKTQSFLKGRRLLRASNYLKRQEPQKSRGRTTPRASETLELPPEICTLHVGVKGRLCRGAMRLPSVLYSLEMALLAAELRDLIGVPMSCFKVLEALTSRACQGDVSYEALEFLGDSVLKFTACTDLFLKEFLQTQEQLGAALYELVRNKTLFYCSLPRGLARYVLVEPFATSLWIPPGLVRCEVQQYSCPIKEQRRKFQSVSCRTLADIVEALVGAYLVDGGIDAALKAMSWLCVPIKFPFSIPESIKASIFGTERNVELCERIDVEELECRLGYHFKNRNILAGAVKFGLEDSPETLTFRRLEFLGDGIFDFVITRHLINAYPDEDEGKLSELKQAIRNNENLAKMAVQHGFHTYLRRMSPLLEQPIREYLCTLQDEAGKESGLSTVCAPRSLGDLLQTLAAAIYVDANFDVDLVWKLLQPLLEPLATPHTVTMHPIKQLETLCVEKGWSWKIKVKNLENQVQAEVWINELVMGNSQNQDRKVARRLAATMALHGISDQGRLVPSVSC